MYSLTFLLNLGQSSVLPVKAFGIFMKLFFGASSSDMITDVDGGFGGNGGFDRIGWGVATLVASDLP